MSYGDIRKGRKVTNTGAVKEFDTDKLAKEMASDTVSNIEVGDFLSELATAIRFRMKLGQSQGDWIEEPERLASDGLIFGEEVSTAAGVKLQVTVSLDASTSMWANRLMKHAGPAFLAFDKSIRKAIADLPQGAVTYAPFVFHEKAFKIPQAMIREYAAKSEYTDRNKRDRVMWPTLPGPSFADAYQAGEITRREAPEDFPLSGPYTRLAPLFKAIRKWEEAEGDTSAVRLDIVLTDGVFIEGDSIPDAELAKMSAQDIRAAFKKNNEIRAAHQDILESNAQQDLRAGRVRTVMLNFMPIEKWVTDQLPERCAQFAVEPATLDRSIRDILSEAIADLF